MNCHIYLSFSWVLTCWIFIFGLLKSNIRQVWQDTPEILTANLSSKHILGWKFAAALLPLLFGKNSRSHHKGATGRVQTFIIQHRLHLKYFPKFSLNFFTQHSSSILLTSEKWEDESRTDLQDPIEPFHCHSAGLHKRNISLTFFCFIFI